MSALKTVNVDICVCTYRRFHLALTLQSIAALILSPELVVTVIVADNDEEPSAKDLVKKVQENFPYPIIYVHAPSRNISIARNACLTTSTAPFLAFIDDDELASPEWLIELINHQRLTNASAVLGPVIANYPDTCPTWLRKENFHSIKPTFGKGRIRTGYTSNALLSRPDIANDLQFENGLGKTGGEDTVFFSEIYKSGGLIDFAPHAVVIENVSPDRLNFHWLARRYFRMGQTHGSILLRTGRRQAVSNIKALALAASKAFFSFGMAAMSPLGLGRTAFWSLRAIFHSGVVARILGKREIKQYG